MAASISEAERLLEKWTVSWEVKLWRQLWNFEDDLWAEGIILRYTSKLEKGLFILWPSEQFLKANAQRLFLYILWIFSSFFVQNYQPAF